MKKLLIVAALTLASLFGGMSAAQAGGQVCLDLNINGVEYGPGCTDLPEPALPELPA